MVRIPFFGSDDDEPKTDESVGNLRITSNSDIDVNVVDVEDDVAAGDIGGLNVHTISIDESTPEQPESADSTGASTVNPPSPEEPTVSTPPDAAQTGPNNRGTFVLPDDRHFMQTIGTRGKNGHGSIVETVYVLTGASYTRPTDVICLDNPEYYASATRSSVQFYPRQMAEKVASLYPDGETPNLIARFHTHPGGTLIPSSADKGSAAQVRQSFVNAFGTEDFEFFQGIHGLEEHGRNPNSDERHDLSVSQNHLEWMGERFRHKLAVFDRYFEESKSVAIHES